MSLGTQIAWDDTVLPFQLDHADIRGRFVRLTRSLDEILAQHAYPPQIEALLTEMTLLTALIGQTMSLRWKLSLQVRGDGPVKLIATDYFAPASEGEAARLRAYASFDAQEVQDGAQPFDLLGEGYFGILIDQGSGTAPYQGITPLSGGSLSASAETYFAQSEQLPTRFALSFGSSTLPGQKAGWRAGGMMIQHMPKQSPFAAGASEGAETLLTAKDLVEGEDGENWDRVNILLDTIDETELVGPILQPTDVLVRLFHEEQPRIFDTQPVSFGCTCSEQRVKDSLAGTPVDELRELVTETGMITADCQFCGAQYAFSPESVGGA
ncbi:Chaperonin [Candidatus Rhodobacter oscarellae]|uniref:Chaperonin n=1 Tax=Candidatus Rhodobacter oscarellae TaxID=1675527 RepID=A0A0J9E829_9RHOB|nr:Hsp33 family molecular chaperone HslO [Candidatus Rhodobacter lobularis]KMW58882.1 Chaperonin [Candidatus Rhodobacter lobularis]